MPDLLTVAWEHALLDYAQRLKGSLAQIPCERLAGELLRVSDPELNLQEGSLLYVKRVEFTNFCCQPLAHLRQGVNEAITRSPPQVPIISDFFKQTVFLKVYKETDKGCNLTC
jgi:hypothetical protein